MPREAPRGPKAGFDAGRGGGYVLRGRGYAGRGELRDTREGLFQRREVDRDFTRRESFDNRDRRPSPIARNRSRTPPIRDYREARDIDLNRVGKGSRDGPLSATSTTSDTTAYSWSYGRGGNRGRGRGDWDSRGRGRGHFFDDREAPLPRSRSRDRVWDRDNREDRVRDHERDPGRREEEKKDWDREPDRYRRDPPFQRPDSRTSSGTHTRPSTPHSASIQPHRDGNVERSAVKPNASTTERGRRLSTTTMSIDSSFKDDARAFTRPEPETPSSPPQAPQVPAFGSIANKDTFSPQKIGSRTLATKDEAPPSAPARSEITDPIRAAPRAPKAELNNPQPPTGPKAGPSYVRRPQPTTMGSPGRVFDTHHDGRISMQSAAPAALSLSAARFGPPQRPIAAQFLPQTALSPQVQSARATKLRPIMLNQARPSHVEFTSAQGQHGFELPSRNHQPDSSSRMLPHAASTGSPVRAAPKGPKAIQQPSIRAPMGPKVPPKAPPKAASNNIWINPNMKQRQPSIMNRSQPTMQSIIPAKRDYSGEARATSQLRDHTQQHGTQVAAKSEPNELHARADASKVQVSHTGDAYKSGNPSEHVTEPVSLQQDLEDDRVPASGTVHGIVTRASSASDEEEATGLDEADFEEAERQFAREMRALEGKRPATPRHHVELMPLLEEIDALASAAEDLANGAFPSSDDIEEEFQVNAPLGLPSPTSESIERKRFVADSNGTVRGHLIARTPPLSEGNLPYLISGPLTPVSELSSLEHDNLVHERIKDRMLDFLSEKQGNVEYDYASMRQQYATFYKEWRIKVDAIDQRKVSEETAATPSPVSVEVPAIPVTPFPEGRRVGRSSATANASELDLQRTVEASKQEAVEAAELRERQAQENQALADLQKEAAIPDMLAPDDRKASLFDDTNQIIRTCKALEVLEFVPPEDDFTPEEHLLFTESYLLYPKKWGQIAATIPGRDYQDCIQHYYQTKRANKYKLMLGGKGGAQKAKKPPVVKATKGKGARQNALMSNLSSRGFAMYDGSGNEPDALTQSGRPRRGAAPTFGDKDVIGDSDITTPVPTPTRRGAGAGKVELAGDSTSEKPTVKRGRGPGTKEKSKRSKAPLLAAAPGPSPTKKEVDVSQAKSKEPNIEELQRPQEPLPLEIRAPPPINQMPDMGTWQVGAQHFEARAEVEIPLIQPPPSQPLPQQQQLIIQDAPSRVQPQTSSYWSVPEQQDFLKLVAHYGTDWQQISQALKTKTHIMVSVLLA